MDDLGVSLFQETSYEILVNTPILKRMEHGLILNFVWSPKKLVRRVVSSQKKLPIHHCLGCLNESKRKLFFFKFRYFKDWSVRISSRTFKSPTLLKVDLIHVPDLQPVFNHTGASILAFRRSLSLEEPFHISNGMNHINSNKKQDRML